MNNAVSLAVFLLCIIMKDSSWDFAAETVTLVLVATSIGLMGSFAITYRTLFIVPVLISFPISVVMVPLLKLLWPPTC